ncbi:SNF2-related protein [Vulgatibacter sp.]|uniref:SNF2-related protein n=1 Tax=Vulgatibacter sp. TaxID=1971226 RepID=UPI003569F691
MIPSSTILEECRTLLELGRAARSLGLASALDEPLGALAARGLTPKAASLLAQILGNGDGRTLGDLLSQGPAERFLLQHATGRMRNQLLEAARRRLLDALADRPRAQGGTPLPPLPAGDEALRDWARRTESEALLSAPATVLGDVLPLGVLDTLARWNAAARIGDLAVQGALEHTGAGTELGTSGRELLRTAAWRWLVEEAEARRRGLLEEDRPLAIPDEPLGAALSEKLLALRRSIRAEVQPRSGARPLLDFEADPPAFVAEVEPKIFPPQRGKLAQVRLELAGWERTPPKVVCSCGKASCVHGLTTVDAVLHFLGDPTAAGARAHVLEELALPDWQRALRALDRWQEQRGKVAEEREEVRLSWRLHLDVTWQLRPWLQKRNKRGWSAGSRVTFRELADRLPDLTEADRRALAALVPGDLRDAGAVPDALLAPRVPAALAQLVGHPRIYLGHVDEPIDVRIARIGLRAVEVVGGVDLQPTVGDDTLSFERLQRLIGRTENGGFAVHVERNARRCILVPVDDEAMELLRILDRHGAHFPREAMPELLARTAPLEEKLQVALPPSLRGEEVEPHKDLVLRLAPHDGPGLQVDVRVRVLPGASAWPPGEGPKEVAAAMGGKRFFAHRHRAAEATWVRELLATLPIRPDAEEEPFRFVLDRGEEALDLLAWLQENAPPRVSVEWQAKKRAVRRVGGRDLRVRVERARDWFGVEGTLSVDGEQVKLAVLLDAARSGARWVEVRDGLWVQLESELVDRLRNAADHLAEKGGRLHAGIAAAPVLESLGEAAGEFEADGSHHELLGRIRSAGALDPQVPAGLQAELRPYQAEGFRWLARLAHWGAGGVLADDMGLGKTVQALALLLHRAPEGPALVVAPTSVCGNWMAEASRFAPSLRLTLYRDLTDARREETLASLGAGDVLVASYGQIARDPTRFAAHHFATLVLDEAQAVKNPATQRAKAIRGIDAAFRMALTGTPLENHLGELWSLYHVVFPSLLGAWQRFRERFGLPIERSGDRERRQALSRLLAPFLLRRTKGEVAKELPPRIEVQVPVELSAEEKQLYEDARLAAIGRLAGVDGAGPDGVSPLEGRRFEVLAAITRLRLCACNPRLYDESSTIPSSKLDRLLDLVEELREEGHRALVFSQFTRHLALVREALRERKIRHLYLDGQTPAEERDALVARFQAEEADVFLVSLKAGGTGLNLTAASYVIHLDPWWNPAVEDQATDRAHRIGQEKPVTVLRLIAKGTIEEAILGLHGDKRALIAGVLDGGADGRVVGAEELLELLRAQPA